MGRAGPKDRGRASNTGTDWLREVVRQLIRVSGAVP